MLNYKTRLELFCMEFMKSIKAYYEVICKIHEINPESAIIRSTLNSMASEYSPETMPDLDYFGTSDDVEWFLDREWCKMQTLLAMGIQDKFNLETMSFLDYIQIRDLLEGVFNEKVDKLSSYSRIIGFLEIPVSEVPDKYINTLYRADEFVSASYLISGMVSKVRAPNFISDTTDSYREHLRHHADCIIDKLHSEGLFGTYELEYFVELLMCYKLDFPYIGPLYITSDFPKISVSHDDLAMKVNHLWDRVKHREELGGDIE